MTSVDPNVIDNQVGPPPQNTGLLSGTAAPTNDPVGDVTPPVETDPNSTDPWDVVGSRPDEFVFDTRTDDLGPLEAYSYDDGTGAPAAVATQVGGTGVTTQNADGSVTLGDVGPHTRQVQQEELVSHQMGLLTNSNSKYMQDARRQGLEQANAMGGLGGTLGVGASMQAALRAAQPIAEADAMAYRTAATENLQALNQFSQLNLQRGTQMELAHLDANTRKLTTRIAASSQMAMARLNAANERDISVLNQSTQLRLQEMTGQIQARMADLNYVYTSMLNTAQQTNDLRAIAMQGDYGLANTDLRGQWDAYTARLDNVMQGEYGLRNTQMQIEGQLANTTLSAEWDATLKREQFALERQMNYTNTVVGTYDGYLQRIADLNGVEMDDAARQRAIASITAGANAQMALLAQLYGVPPYVLPSPTG